MTPHAPAEADPAPVYKWVLVGMLFLIGGLNYADRSVLSAMYPLLRQGLGMSDLGLAGIGTVFLWSYALASPLAGVLGDRKSRRTIILVCVSGWSLVMAITSLVSSGGQLLFMRFLLGITEALYIPASMALISEFHGVRTKGLAMGIHVAGMSVGSVAGGTYGGFVGEHYGWRAAIFSLGACGLLVAVLASAVLRRPPPVAASAPDARPANAPAWQSARTVLRSPVAMIVILQAMLLSIGTWIFANWLPLYFSEVFHLTLGSAGFAGTAALNIGSILGVLAGGWLSDYAAARNPLNRLLVQAALYLLAVPFLFLFFCSGQLNLIAFSIFAFSVCRAMGQASESPTLCERLPANAWATAQGVFNAVNCLAGGLGILVSVYLKSLFGLKIVFVGSSALIVVSAAMLIVTYFAIRKREMGKLS